MGGRTEATLSPNPNTRGRAALEHRPITHSSRGIDPTDGSIMMFQSAARGLSARAGRLLARRGVPIINSTSVASTVLRGYSATRPGQSGSQFIFSRLGDTAKITPIIAKLQQECWDGYVSTGRGCHTLFQVSACDVHGSSDGLSLPSSPLHTPCIAPRHRLQRPHLLAGNPLLPRGECNLFGHVLCTYCKPHL